MNAASRYVAWIIGGIFAAAALFGALYLGDFRATPKFITDFLTSVPQQRFELVSGSVFWLISFSNLVFPVAVASLIVIFSCLRATKEITRRAQLVMLLSYVVTVTVVALVVPAGFVAVTSYLLGADTTGYDPAYERLNRVAATLFFPTCLYLIPEIFSRSKLHNQRHTMSVT